MFLKWERKTLLQNDMQFEFSKRVYSFLIKFPFFRKIPIRRAALAHLLNIFCPHIKLCMKSMESTLGTLDFTKYQEECLSQFNT